MPRFNRNRPQNPNQNHSHFPVQDSNNSIPFYNARLFSMYESLIQSYMHFTYHSNYMYNVLAQTLHGTRESINSNPYPWLIIPNPTHQYPQPQPHPPPSRQPQSQQPPSRQPQSPQPQPPQPQPPQPQSQWRPNQPQSATIETNIINALFGMMNRPAERRLTAEQLNECIETAQFGSIVHPITTCVQ